MAAVQPAGPEPMITTFSGIDRSFHHTWGGHDGVDYPAGQAEWGSSLSCVTLQCTDDLLGFCRNPIMSIAEQAALSLDEFLQLPETKPATEFWDGHVRQKPMPTTKRSVIQGEFTECLN